MVVHDNHTYLCTEEQRLKDDRERKRYWKKWGPYTAERQWATGVLSGMLCDKALLTLICSEGGLFVSKDFSIDRDSLTNVILGLMATPGAVSLLSSMLTKLPSH